MIVDALLAVGLDPALGPFVNVSAPSDTVTTETTTTLTASPDAVYIGDLDDVANIIVLQGTVTVLTTETETTTRSTPVSIGTAAVALDHSLCYKTKSTKGDLCSAAAPVNRGGACETEEDCGGSSGDEDTDETAFCLPNKFPKGLRVTLADRLEPAARVFDVKKLVNFCAPADKNGEGVIDPDTHLRGYAMALTRRRCADTAPTNPGAGCTREADCGGRPGLTGFCAAQPRSVKQPGLRVINQFHAPDRPLTIDALKPDRLLVPTAKGLTTPPGPPGPSNVDHYKCYKAKVPWGAPKFKPILGVRLDDQLTPGVRAFDLAKPTRLCTPADKNGEGVKDDLAHLMCYQAQPSRGLCAADAPLNASGVCATEKHCGGRKGTSFCVLQPRFQKVTGIFVDNQLAQEQVETTREDELCVPSGVSRAD